MSDTKQMMYERSTDELRQVMGTFDSCGLARLAVTRIQRKWIVQDGEAFSVYQLDRPQADWIQAGDIRKDGFLYIKVKEEWRDLPAVIEEQASQ